MDTKFFLEDPSILVTDMVLFPTATMTREQKLNALVRLALIITAGMYVMEYKYWSTFLLSSILLIIAIQYVAKSKPEKYTTDVSSTRENFSIVPTYLGDDFETTVVAPTFAEEWRILPPQYNEYTSVENIEPLFQEPPRPQAYPYGQYLTRTNLLPSDEYMTHQNSTGGAQSAREYVNSSFRKHRMANQEMMSKILKKRIARRFRHSSSNDTVSSFHSY